MEKLVLLAENTQKDVISHGSHTGGDFGLLGIPGALGPWLSIAISITRQTFSVQGPGGPAGPAVLR